MHFFKQMSGFFMHSVCLPEELTSKLSDLIGKNIELKLSNGTTWRVNLISSGTKLALEDGWFNFVRDNSIKQNDLLLFKFKQGFEFKVVIFGSNGLKKSLEEDGFSDLMQIGLNSNSNSNSNDSDYNMSEGEEDEVEYYKKFSRKKPKDGILPISDVFYSPRGILITKDQFVKAQELSKNIKKENPTFLQVLKPAHITSRFRLTVPRHFGRKYLPNEKKNFILRRPNNNNKTWKVGVICNKKIHEIRWIKFVHDNKLLEDDVCLFELDKSEDEITFNVHVGKV